MPKAILCDSVLPFGAGQKVRTLRRNSNESVGQMRSARNVCSRLSGQQSFHRRRLWVAVACAVNVLTACASREFDDGSVELSGPLPDASAGQLEDHAINTGLHRLGLSGASIHESENKQPLHLKRLIDATVQAALKAELLHIYPLEGRSAPQLLRPAGGFGSPIGTETYHLRGQSDLPDSPQQPPSADALQNLQRQWLLVIRYGSQLGFFQTARHLRNYFLVKKQTGTQKPVLELESGTAFGALQQIGYWARPDDQERGGLSGGEKVLRRNRALILLDLLAKVRTTPGKPRLVGLRSYLNSLAAVDSDAQMLWFRTHTLVRPQAGSDWDLALGDFSVLAYSFAHISDVDDEGFRLSVLSYDFLFGIHSWSKESTADLLEKWCGDDVRKDSLHEDQCDELISQQSRLGSPSLALLAQKGLANEFSVRGYSPVLVSSERISYAGLTPQLFDQLTREVQLAGSSEP